MSNLATIVNNILADSGIDDLNVVVTTGSYNNPAWITALSWSKITGTPTTLAGYGITDAVPSSRTITINGLTQDLSANRTWTIVAGVSSVNAGTGISVNQTTGDITVTNTGVLSINGSTGAISGVITTSNYTSYAVAAYGTSAGDIDADWGQSFKTFDPIPTGTPPISSPNIRTINVGDNYNRRTQVAFDYVSTRSWFRRRIDGYWAPWAEYIHSLNYTDYAVQTTGQSNWNNYSVIANVVGLLAWKNYGNNHVIFDASQSTSPSGTSVNNTNSDAVWGPAYPTLMGWNGTNTYGVRVDSARLSDSSTYATSAGNADTVDGYHASAFALVNGNTGQSFGVFELTYADTLFNPSLAPRTGLNPMSIKMWDNYFAGIGLGVDYGTVIDYYGRSGHVDTQVYFDAGGGNWYRSSAYGQGWQSWQKYVTENSGTWNISVSGSSAYSPLLTSSGSYLTQYGSGTIGYVYAITSGSSGLFPTSDNSNAIITVNRHPGDYYSQLGFSSNGEIYYRRFSATVINTTLPWVTLLTSNNYNNYAPTLTGGGASGTWNISITGSAGNVSFNSLIDKTGGTGTYQTSGDFRAPIFYDSQDTGYYVDPNQTSVLNELKTLGQLYINNYSPTVYLQDIDHRSAMIHVNSNIFYVLRGSGNNSTSWSQYNGYWPLEISLENNSATFGGTVSAPVGDFRAPIFYDSENTSYYLNPNGSSNLYSLYLNAVESANLYGIRGRFTNEYIHLYNKVGVGDPNGWGSGETSTPIFGFSTYGGANFAYGNGALSTFNGQVNIKGSSMYVSASQLHIGQQSAGTAQMSFESWGAYTGAIAMNSSGAFTFGGQGASSWNWKTYCTYNGDYTTSGNTVLSLNSAGSLFAVSDMRAPIFYDSSDTSYYVDPNSLSVLKSVQIGAYNQYSITLPTPSNNYGNGRIYIRIQPVGGRIVSFKISISSTWNWTPAFGFVSADVSYYCDGTNLVYPQVAITSATGQAANYLTIGNLVIENGYISLPIYSANTNTIFVKFEGAPSFDWNLITTSGWESVAWPGSAVVNIPGALTTGGNITMAGNLVATQSWVNSQGFVTGGPYLPLSGGTMTGSIAMSGNNITGVNDVNSDNFRVGNAVYFGGGNNYFNWDGARINSNVGIQSGIEMRAPIFYDSQNTAYYLDPSNFSNLYSANFASTVNFASATNWFGGYGPGSGPGIGLENLGTFARFAFWGLDFYDWNDGIIMTINNGYVSSPSSFRAPIFYDSQNTDYFLDPNSGSVLYQVTTNGRIYSNEWIQFSNYTGLYSPNNGAHFRPNTGSYGSWLITGARNGWPGIEFESLSNGNVSMMIGSNSNETGFHNNSYGWQFRWTTGTMYVFKGTYGGGTQATVWDSVNSPRASNAYLMYYDGFTLDADTMATNSTGFTYGVNAPTVGPIARFSTGGGYDMWLSGSYYTGGNSFYLRTRNGDNGTFNPWREIITSGNIANQYVYYATNAGNADTVDGYHESAFMRYYGSSSSGNFQTFQSVTGVLRFDQVENIGSGSWTNAPTGIYTYGGVLSYRGANFGFQMYAAHIGGIVYKTQWSDDQYSGWQRILDTQNYGNYTLIRSGDTVTGVFNFMTNNGGYCGSLSNASLQVYSGSNNSAYMSFHKGGYYAVNMGLDTDNVIRIGGWSAPANLWQLDMSGNNTVAGNMTAVAFFESSDKRLKKIVDENYRLESITSIKPKFYEKNGRLEAGYIAQEVQEIYSHAVQEGTEGYLNLSYGQVHTLKIANLEDSVDEIKKKIKELEEKLNSLY